MADAGWQTYAQGGEQQQRCRHTSDNAASTAAVVAAAFLRTMRLIFGVCWQNSSPKKAWVKLDSKSMARFSEIMGAMSYLAGRAWAGARIVLRELWVLFATWIKVSKAM